MSGSKFDAKEFKKLVGDPKIIFMLGGPAVGKGTQCQKLVEEFGYTHISTGELLRKEMHSGTKEGDRIKKNVSEGGLVPFELTVQILMNAMVANPSKNYLIDGFPRAVDQAQYFEQNVAEMQQIIYLNVPQEVMLERAMKRSETSSRPDDQPDIVKKRVQNYFDQSYPVVEYYQKFGKVRNVDAQGDVVEVYNQVRKAVLPQTMFIMGPKASGKTAIATDMAHRSNMKHIIFPEWKKQQGMKDADDEECILKMIDCLSKEIMPRVIIEDFPENLFQAKFFLRNCTSPSNVFALQCGIDVSQERMHDLGEDGKGYVSSTILSQKIRVYNDKAKALIPFLKENTNFAEISTEESLEKTMEDVNSKFEPTVIHIRPGASSNDLRKEITEKLNDEHGFINLDINALIRDENERKTAIGQEMHSMVQSNRIIPAEMMVRMLKKIIYSGNPELNKYILTSFPDIIEQAKEFEINCSKISCIIYSTTEDNIVEIKNNNLSLFNIDSLFQKEFRLKTMSSWDYSIFEEKLGKKIEFGLTLGLSFSGKTEMSNILKTNLDFTVIDMKAIHDKIKSTKLNEDGEPDPEAEVPIGEVEAAVSKIINGPTTQKRVKYIFDGYVHQTQEEFIAFTEQFGVPTFILKCNADIETLKKRFCTKNEADAYPEDDLEKLKASVEADAKVIESIESKFEAVLDRIEIIEIDTDKSIETTTKLIVQKFSPQVILLNHEKRLGVDTTCANLAIKFNMIYISVYQIIQQHIKNNTEWGKLLKSTKRKKDMAQTSQVRDEFNEAEYSPSLYDQKTVMDLIRTTIMEKRTNQGHVILEGLCNSGKLTNEQEKLQLRNMDEFFQIEKHIGEVKAIIGLQFSYEQEAVDVDAMSYEDFGEQPEAPVPKAEGEGEAEAAPEEGADGDKPKEEWKKENFTWSKTDKKSMNLPQIFINCKGENTVHEVRTAEQYSTSQYEAISKSLDEFCQKVTTEKEYIYVQVVFQE